MLGQVHCGVKNGRSAVRRGVGLRIVAQLTQTIDPAYIEMLRIKAFLIVDRNATRDYLDVAARSNHLGLGKSAAALERPLR